MITQEDIDAMRSENDFETIRKDVERAYHSVTTAIHYLEETFEYESHNLDYTYETLKLIQLQMAKMLGKAEV